MTRRAADVAATLVPGAVLAAYLLVLGALTALGAFVRPTADDYCFLGTRRVEGAGGVFARVYQELNGRFGNAAVLELVFSEYELASRTVPGLALAAGALGVGAVIGLVLLTCLGARRTAAMLGGPALGAGVVVALHLGKPVQYQTVYQITTIISHSLPIVIAAALVVAVAALSARGHHRWAAAAGLVGGAWLGTFNEAFDVVAVASVGLVVALHLLGARTPVRPGTSTAIGVGVVVGFFSVYFSAGSRNRQASFDRGGLLDAELVATSWRNWLDVAATVLSSSEALVLLAGALAVGTATARPPALRSVRAGTAALVVPVAWAVGASLVATFVYTYSFGGFLGGRERTWPTIAVPLLLAWCWYGLLAGSFLAALARRSGVPALRPALAVLLLLAAAPAAAGIVADVRDLTATTVARAVAWDRQDAAVRSAVSAGAEQIEWEPLPIDGLIEPFHPGRTADTMPARCLPDLYGADEVVRAGEP